MIKKILIGFFVIVFAVIGIVMNLSHENALLIHPKGVIARQELELIVVNIALMLVIILPTYFLLFFVVWKYCIRKKNVYNPDHTPGPLGELIMWILPSIIVIVMAIVTWYATHKLDPYKPIESHIKPLKIQVVALNWKWLFIYPEQGIAILNYLLIPEKTPIHLNLTADHSPMNSFWIPQLSGQIYAMTGMSTQLHLMADGLGEYAGRAVEINGEGYAGMTFVTKSTSSNEFEKSIEKIKQSPDHLTHEIYSELTIPAVNQSVIFYSNIEKDLYHQIVHQ